MKVKITVLEKVKTGKVFDKYAHNVEEECPMFDIGHEFVVEENQKMPEGFCSWAWADIHRDIEVLMFGGNFPWINDEGVMISSCTDGLRPVIFKLERIQE